MDTQNVTLALPKEILQRAKLIAVKRRVSLSRLLTGALIEIVSGDENYEFAKRRSLQRLEEGLDLGTNGTITWTRDELHDR